MPMFPLAGGELVALILLVAVGRWMARSWWRRKLEDETLERLLPRRKPPAPRRLERPELRLVRGGRYRAESRPSSAAGQQRHGA